MTRAQQRSKSQLHNRMKRLGYKWYRRKWWEVWNFQPLLIRLEEEEERDEGSFMVQAFLMRQR